VSRSPAQIRVDPMFDLILRSDIVTVKVSDNYSSPISDFWWETSDLRKNEKKAGKIRGNSGPTPVARGWLRG